MISAATSRLDVIIPVYNEGANILPALQSLIRTVRTPLRVLICYDREDDNTLTAIRKNRDTLGALAIEFVRNQGRGAHGAVLAGFAVSAAPFVLVMMADDDYNAGIIDAMVAKAESGCDCVCHSLHAWRQHGRLPLAQVRPGAQWQLYAAPSQPVADRDATNGFRLFARRALDQIVIESDSGFCYSIELLVKCHRLHWRIGEVPSQWRERTRGTSRFQVVKWLPAYLRWYFYAFATTYLRRSARTVRLKSGQAGT